MKTSKLFLLILLFSNFLKSNLILNQFNNPILIYRSITEQNCSKEYNQYLKNIFSKFHIKYEEINNIDHNNENNLHVIFNPINIEKLPKYYIIYQTLDKPYFDENYQNKLRNAISIWDVNWANIDFYRNNNIQHYYYLPKNYEFEDPVILPCFLPIANLYSYKEILSNSNTNDTDTSSHLPTLFVYCLLKKPKKILELGVASGGTTKLFYKISNLCEANLVGVDIQEQFRSSYNNLKNTTFYCMNDLHFPKMLSNDKFDVIFIDTSHEFDHTLKEIELFLPFLQDNGRIIFHDSNVTPLFDNTGYYRINNTFGKNVPGNPRGVTYALKKFFSIYFDEAKYCNFDFTYENSVWHLIHYPFCNGLTIISRNND